MKKLISLTSILLFVFVSVRAQENKNLKKTNFWVGPQFSVAAADLADNHTVGIGVHAQVAHRISPKVDLLGSVRYNYFFGKKMDGYYEPGGGGSYGGHQHPGMNDIGITGGARLNFTDNIYGDGEAGLCMGFSDGLSESSLFALTSVGYVFGRQSKYTQAVALFFGLCGDPKIHIGVRYGIRL